jgi:hypothetical protein
LQASRFCRFVRGSLDIVPVISCADAIVALHQKRSPTMTFTHFHSGTGSQTFRQLTRALAEAAEGRAPVFVPALTGSFTSLVNSLANRRGTSLGHGASLLKVFIPYLVWNTVFDNQRVVSETGLAPAPFSTYSYPLLQFSKQHDFTYQYEDWPMSSLGIAQ